MDAASPLIIVLNDTGVLNVLNVTGVLNDWPIVDSDPGRAKMCVKCVQCVNANVNVCLFWGWMPRPWLFFLTGGGVGSGVGSYYYSSR